MIRRLAFILFCISGSITISGQDSARQKSLEIYGFAQADIGYDVKQINPNWFDAMRITKLPSSKDQFAPDGKVFFSVRQTRFGVTGYTKTPVGELKAVFDFDLFGVGVDEGQTTMRLRNAYGELGRFLVGQANSPFMDGDVWPNTMEYWGPTGMVFFRNIQFRYAPLKGTNEVFIALERPGASADQGTFSERTELDSVKGQFNLPDLSAHYRRNADWGHVQFSGMLRSIKWKDFHSTGGYNISGSVVGWGLHFSTVVNLTNQDVFRGSFIYGEGVENYMQDAPYDVGIVNNPGNAYTPIKGKALPITGIHAFLDHKWNNILATAIGYSSAHIKNTDASFSNTYRQGQYAIVNLVATPFPDVLAAVELQYGRRENFTDGFSSDDIKVMFSFKYSFHHVIYK